MSHSAQQTDFGLAPALERRAGRFFERLARALASLGGIVLVGLIALSVVSITGRRLVGLDIGLGPVPGDFEIIEAGCAFAVFAFLPWCQIRRGHVTVDVLARLLGERAQAGLELAGNIVMAAAACLIAWRLVLGMLDKQRYGETTFILQFPAWWGYAAAMIGAILFALVALYTVWRSYNAFCGAGAGGQAAPTAGAPAR
jgi:TRAP-type C4-dicarboxylate transport system permease small subunit